MHFGIFTMVPRWVLVHLRCMHVAYMIEVRVDQVLL
jgi:hypothetical protein